MKGIIVDVDGKYLIVATRRGDFKRIYNRYNGASIGDEIEIMDSPMGRNIWVATAACFLVLLLAGYGLISFMQPTTYITLDINPSLELCLNKYNRVLEVKALNRDGVNIIGDDKSFHYIDLDKAVRILLDRAISLNYLDLERNTVLFAVSHVKDDIPSNIDDKIKQIAESELENKFHEKNLNQKTDIKASDVDGDSSSIKEKAKIVVLVENTTMEKRKEAKKMDVSQGKLLLYDKLKELKPDLTISHVKEASVTQIVEEFKELKTPSPKGLKNTNSLKDFEKAQKAVEKDLKELLKDEMKVLKDEYKEKKETRGDSPKGKDEIKELKKEIKEKEKILKEEIKDWNKKVKNEIKEKKVKGKFNKEDREPDKIRKKLKEKDKTPGKHSNNKNGKN